MIKEFIKTLSQVITLRSIVGYNGLVFALKKTPIIGRFIPDRLYATKELKIIYWIFHVMKELFMLFIGKIFGLGMVYLVALLLKTEYMDAGMNAGLSGPNLYANFALVLFVIYALCGILINRSVFRCTTEKEYLVFMLRMDARKLNTTLFIYDILKLVIGYFIAAIVAILCGCPFWVWLGIPVLAVFIKLFGTGAQAFIYRIKRKHGSSLKDSTALYAVRLSMVLIMFPLILIMIINGSVIPFPVVLGVCALLVLLGIWGFLELKKFDPFLHKRVLSENIARTEIENYRNPDTTKNFKKIKAKGNVKGNKKGFEYLNALFVRRHRRMLVLKPIIISSIMLLITGLFIYGFIQSYYDQFGSANCVKMVMNNLLNMITFGHYEDALMPYDYSSVGAFFRWGVQYHLLALLLPLSLADNSFKCTQAMYINCDNSLMTFSFFKQPQKIIKLFDIRVKQLLKINIGPCIACGLICNLILFYTGGQDYPLHYVINLIIPFMISLIYSTTWLLLYYLFQPFTTTVKVKSGTYIAARVIISSVLVVIFWIPANSWILAAILLVFSVLFMFFIRKLVYKHAPRTWRIKA